MSGPTLTTLGHGAATAEAFADLLVDAGLAIVVDVRRFPGSRRHPQFGRDAMTAWLSEVPGSAQGIAYRWLPELGGRRRPAKDSPHAGLRDPAFRGYADHMATVEFARGLSDLLALAGEAPTAVMCAESLWWRCHRRLLADHLVLVEGRTVEHLFHDGRRSAHAPTPEARRDGATVVYDLGTQRSLLDT